MLTFAKCSAPENDRDDYLIMKQEAVFSTFDYFFSMIFILSLCYIYCVLVVIVSEPRSSKLDLN